MEEIFHNIESYLPAGYPRICLLDTDIREPELLICRIAEAVSQAYPKYFSGKEPYVFYRLKYTPPYEKFQELRNMILQIRQAAGFCSEYHGMLCIDPSEYRGHEEEEFFIAVLKYLYDNTVNSSVILVCCQYSEQEMAKLANICMKYFPVCKEQIHIFEEETICKYICSSYREKHMEIDEAAAALLAEVLQSPCLVDCRSLQLLDRLPYEIRNCRRGESEELSRNREDAGGRCIYSERKITAIDVKAFFSDPESSLCMMAGHPLIAERNWNHEYAF